MTPVCCLIVFHAFNLYQAASFLDWTKFKAFADSKLMVAGLKICFFAREENIVGKGENAGYQHSLLFSLCFHKAFSSGT